jgi:zinc D-Ala-D-Ala carboxypeptidase
MIVDWQRFANFTKAEFDCRHTGSNEMQTHFVERLQELRDLCGFALPVISGYRDPTHPIEAAKSKPGWHSKGLAADISCGAMYAHEIVRLAMQLGFTGIGVSQRDEKPRFIHLDLRTTAPVIYSY